MERAGKGCGGRLADDVGESILDPIGGPLLAGTVEEVRRGEIRIGDPHDLQGDLQLGVDPTVLAQGAI